MNEDAVFENLFIVLQAILFIVLQYKWFCYFLRESVHCFTSDCDRWYECKIWIL